MSTRPILVCILLLLGGLASAADQKEIARLMKEMTQDDYVGMRCHDRLVEIGQPAADALLAGLSSPTHRVRYWSASAIARIGDPRGYEPLVKLVREDPNEIVRSVALWHLQVYEKKEVFALAVKALSDKHRMVRGWAMRLLRENGRTEAGPELEKLMTSTDVLTRVDAVYAIVTLTDKGQIEFLKKVIKEDPSRDVRLQALRCLTVVRTDPKVLSPMIDALMDTDEEVRRMAVKLLRRGADQLFGYIPSDKEKERLAAAAKWREWYDKNLKKLKWNEERRRFEIEDRTPPPES